MNNMGSQSQRRDFLAAKERKKDSEIELIAMICNDNGHNNKKNANKRGASKSSNKSNNNNGNRATKT